MSKDTFHAAFDDGKVRKFANSQQGFDVYEKYMYELEYLKDETKIGVESTGIYHEYFCVNLSQRGWHIILINPLITSQMISSGLRMVKTDSKDARVIREATLLGKGYTYTDTPDIIALKSLVSERADLVEMKSSLTRRMNVHEIRKNTCSGALYDSYDSIYLSLSSEIKRIEKRMKLLVPETQLLLRSIPGIGITASALLVAYIGDISRFSSPEKLVAYIGIDPRVKQSGTSIHGKGYITKRGNVLLRKVLFQSAFIAKRHNLEFTKYYARKRIEGKHHTSIICALERKLIHVIFAVWKRRTPFVK